MTAIYKLFTAFFAMALMVLMQGCYKDKGNYSYTDADALTITASAPDAINVLLQDSLKIATNISSTGKDAAGYTYEWVLYQNIGAPLTRYTLGTEHDLAAKITYAPGVYVLNYFVTSKATGIIYKKSFAVTIISALNEGWLVVEEKNSACDIHMIAPNGTIFRNIFSGANDNEKLPAGTARVSVLQDRTNTQRIYVMSPSQAQQLYFANFSRLGYAASWFWENPGALQPQEYFINSSDERFVSKGQVYGINTITAGGKFGLPPAGNYNMAPYDIYSVSTGYIWYDNNGQRFYKQDGNYFNLITFGPPQPANAFDMNAVGKKLLFAGATAGTGVFNCLFKNNNNDSLFIFKLELAKNTPASSVDTLKTAPGLATATKMVMSRKLNYLYYASGNQVYLLDIPAKTARVIYTFPAGTEVRAMKLYYNSKLTTDPDNYNLIAIATNEGGNGKVYQFPLAATGDFAGNTYRNVYTGFGLINEITFKRAP